MVPELYGFLIGIIAGLIPGVHPNTFASLMLSASVIFLPYFESHEIALIIFISSVVYSVVNIIPAVFIGVPDEDTAIAVFPAHRLVLDGQGMKAISVSAVSSFLSAIFSLPVFYIILLSGSIIKELDPLVPLVLSGVAIYLILLEDDPIGGSMSKWRKRGYGATVFILSGVLGLISMRWFSGSEVSILFPLLSGLFGFPTLIAGMTSERIPDQSKEMDVPEINSVLKGVGSGLFVSLFPGISSGVATALSVGKGDDEKRYISSVSSANTANTMLNFAILISAGKIRSGVAQAFSVFASPERFLYLPITGVASAFAALAFTLLFSFPVSRIFQRLNPASISKAVLVFLIASILITGGFDGIGVFGVAGIIGMMTLYLRVRRIHCMGSIILPAILY